MALSTDQKQAIQALVADGLDNQEIAAQVGVSPGTVIAVKAHMSRAIKRNGDGDAEDDSEIANAVAFGLERDLQLALRRCIEQLEPGLTIIDGDREQTIPSGRIDITARDQQGATVVIELKVDAADRDAIGQILSYIGDLTGRDAQVRGILVAREFSARAVAAARAAPNIRLLQYGFQFSFEPVGTI